MGTLVKTEVVRAALSAIKKDAEWLAPFLEVDAEELKTKLNEDSTHYLSVAVIDLNEAAIRAFYDNEVVLDMHSMSHMGPLSRRRAIEAMISMTERNFDTDWHKHIFTDEERAKIKAAHDDAYRSFKEAVLTIVA